MGSNAPRTTDWEHLSEEARCACDCRECGGDASVRPEGDCMRGGIAELLADVAAAAAAEATKTVGDRMARRIAQMARDLLEVSDVG